MRLMTMKNKRWLRIMLIIFGAILLGFVCLCLYVWYIMFGASYEPINAEVYYGDDITYNDDYIAYREDVFKLCIVSRESGELIKEIDLFTSADQFVLGNEGIYVLNYKQHEEVAFDPSPDREAKLIRYPYDEGLVTEYSMDSIYGIGCMDGRLYLECGKELADVDLHNYVDGFDANMYVEENEFGKTEPKKISSGNPQKLYDHNSSHYVTDYATEPDIGGYRGSIVAEFSIDDMSLWTDFLQTDKEKQIHTLLVDRLNLDKYYNRHFKYEYQSDEMIYGICNRFKRWRARRPYDLSTARVEKSYLYCIDADTMQISTKTFDDNRMLLIAFKDYYLYQVEGKVIKENIKSGESEILYQFNSLDCDAQIHISGNAILLADKPNIIDSLGNTKYFPIIME